MAKNKKMLLSLGSIAAVAAPIAAVVACGSGSSNIDDGIDTTINVNGPSQVNINGQMQYDGGQKWQRGIGYEGLMALSDLIVGAAQELGWDPMAQDGKTYSDSAGYSTESLSNGGVTFHEKTDDEETFRDNWKAVFSGSFGKIQDDGINVKITTDSFDGPGTTEIKPLSKVMTDVLNKLNTVIDPKIADEAALKTAIINMFDLSNTKITEMVDNLKNYTGYTQLNEPSYFTDDALGFIGKAGFDQYGSAINQWESLPDHISTTNTKEVINGPWAGMHYGMSGWYKEINDDNEKYGELFIMKQFSALFPDITTNRLGIFKDINNPADRFISLDIKADFIHKEKVSVFKQTNANYTGSYQVQPGDKAAIWNADGSKKLVDAKDYYKGVIKTIFEKLIMGMTDHNAAALYGDLVVSSPSAITAISTLLKNKSQVSDDAFIDTLFDKLNKGQTHWAALSAMYTGVKGMTDENKGASTASNFVGMKDIQKSADLVSVLMQIRGIGGTNVYWDGQQNNHEVFKGRNTKYQ